MCGIAGVVSFTAGSPEEDLGRLLGRIRHRGVAWCQNETRTWGNVALGTNRLPVESDNRNAQPRTSHSGRFHIAYNGEVYNWRRLLVASVPHEENGRIVDETQVVVDYLSSKGEEALNAFDGMYAFIAYDSVEGRLLFARDPMGIKPLYYAYDARKFYIASELKAIAQLASVTEVHEAKPGYLYTFRTHDRTLSTGLSERGYWTYPIGVDHPVNCVALRQELQRAVSECLATDKEVAVHLSGGVDSSGVLALALQSHKNVHVITVGKDDAPDTKAARALARELGFNLLICRVPDEDELFEQVPSIIETVESFEPNLIRQSCAHYYLARAAKDIGATVILCGEGADELFGGYPEFLPVSGEEFFAMRRKFLEDLHRTQLQRVDRVSMKFTLETRVPYLRKGPVMCALSSTHLSSFVDPKRGPAGTKLCLRDAFQGLIPDRWRLRPKMVLSEGMGLGGNDPLRGMFAKIVDRAITPSEVSEIRNQFSDWIIQTAEEAFYFREFHRWGYTKLRSSMNRVFANQINSYTP